MRFKYTVVLKCMLLVLFIPWLGIYCFNLVWGGYLFPMVMFDPGTSLNVSDNVLDGEMARAGSTHSKLSASAFFVFYFGFIGVFAHAFMPQGLSFIEEVFYRKDEEYRFPGWLRRTCCGYSMVVFPALFLFCPWLGPCFWLAVPFLNEGFSIPVTLLYYFVLTVLLVSPFWIYSRPR